MAYGRQSDYFAVAYIGVGGGDFNIKPGKRRENSYDGKKGVKIGI